jgi:hypothetical protein
VASNGERPVLVNELSQPITPDDLLDRRRRAGEVTVRVTRVHDASCRLVVDDVLPEDLLQVRLPQVEFRHFRGYLVIGEETQWQDRLRSS